MATSKRPVLDRGLDKPEVPYRAGGRQQGELSSRKNALADTGTVGYVPGHTDDSNLPGSSLRAGHIYEPRTSSPPARYGEMVPDPDNRRPMPRDQPVYARPTHTGNIVRFLDGHSEIVRSRPRLVAQMNDPDMHPDDRKDLQDEITFRDALHSHKYW